jgi:hypothetical protein
MRIFHPHELTPILCGVIVSQPVRCISPRTRQVAPCLTASGAGFFQLTRAVALLFQWEDRLVAQKNTGRGTPWTDEDVSELKAHSKARTPLTVIAKKMKRTEGALRQKAVILGIGLGHRIVYKR